MHRIATLAVSCVFALVLSGCAGTPGASGAANAADSAARGWASDALLLGIQGVEFNNVTMTQEEVDEERAEIENNEFPEEWMRDMALAGLAYQELVGREADRALLDGQTPGWVLTYYSASKGAVYVVITDRNGGRVASAEIPVGMEGEPAEDDMNAVKEARANWKIDSIEASAAVMAKASEALQQAALAPDSHVFYMLDLEDLEWAIQMTHEERGRVVTAGVDAATGNVTDFSLRLKGLPPGANVSVPPPPPAVLPENIYDNNTVIAGADPANTAGLGICSNAASACYSYPFVAEQAVTIQASLSWMLPANDFDLYVRAADGTEVLTAGNFATTSESVSGTLAAGEYEVTVVAWSVVGETYALEVLFGDGRPVGEGALSWVQQQMARVRTYLG